MSAEKQQEMIKQEENAVFNQVVLFISRVIWLRCPLEFPEGINYKFDRGLIIEVLALDFMYIYVARNFQRRLDYAPSLKIHIFLRE